MISDNSSNRWKLQPQVIAWLILAVSVLLMGYSLYFTQVVCRQPVIEGVVPISGLGGLVAQFSSLAFAAVCVLIVTNRPGNRIGWLCGACALVNSVTILAGNATDCISTSGSPLPGQQYSGWASAVSGVLFLLPATFILLPLWFPDGRFLSPRWRGFWYFTLVYAISSAVIITFSPTGVSATGQPNSTSPFALNFEPPDWFDSNIYWVVNLPLIILALIANASLLLRYRRSDSMIRQQLKVFAFIALSGVFLELMIELTKFVYPQIATWGRGWFYLFALLVGWNGYPVAIGVGVLRYRLYDIEVIIRRTLVYGGLTVSLLAIFLVSVTILQLVFSAISGQQSAIATVISTLVIAALFNPLRRRIQGSIDRRFYRSKYDAGIALEAFASKARAETDLEALTEELLRVVQETVQPESVSLWLMPTTRATQAEDDYRLGSSRAISE